MMVSGLGTRLGTQSYYNTITWHGNDYRDWPLAFRVPAQDSQFSFFDIDLGITFGVKDYKN